MGDQERRLEERRIALQEAIKNDDRATKNEAEAVHALMRDPKNDDLVKDYNDAVTAREVAINARKQASDELLAAQEAMRTATIAKLTTTEAERDREIRELREEHAEEKRTLLRQSVGPQVQAGGAAAAAPGPVVVQGGQLSLIPTFSGEQDYDVEGWIDLIERAQVQFNWPDQQLAAIVKNKLSGKAQVWLRAQEKLALPGFNTWIGHAEGLKHMLESKYLPPKTEQAAILAVMDLNQKPSEQASDFFDRVVLAVDKVNHNVNEDEKATMGYKRMFKHQVSTFFSAGLKQEIRQVVLGSNSPPETMEALRDQAVTTETQLSNKLVKVKELVEVEEKQEAQPAEDPVQSLTKQVEEMAMQQKKFFQSRPSQGRPMSNIVCFNCGLRGHISRNCQLPSNKRGNGRGRGRGNYSRAGYNSRGSRPYQYSRRKENMQCDVCPEQSGN